MATLTRLPHDRSIVAAEITVSFLQPARGELVAFGKVIRVGQRRCVAEAKIWSADIVDTEDLATFEAEPVAVGLLNLAPIPK